MVSSGQSDRPQRCHYNVAVKNGHQDGDRNRHPRTCKPGSPKGQHPAEGNRFFDRSLLVGGFWIALLHEGGVARNPPAPVTGWAGVDWP